MRLMHILCIEYLRKRIDYLYQNGQEELLSHIFLKKESTTIINANREYTQKISYKKHIYEHI